MSFVGDFVAYCRSRTDAPPDYHVMAAMVGVGVAAGNDVFTEGRGRNLYCNLWGVNIGPSGIGKSVPLDILRRVLDKAGLGHHVSSESFSTEGLYGELKVEPVRLFLLQEFSAFQQMMNREYNHGSQQFLTEMYDVPDVYRRKLTENHLRKYAPDGVIEFNKPCISILGATAPEWFSEQFRLSALRSGFLVRYLYCPRDRRGEYVEDPGPFDEAAEEGLADHLRQVAERSGRADFGRVLTEFNAWERANRESLAHCPADFAGMRSRAGAFVKKVAMIVHLSNDPRHLRISPEALQTSIKFVERTHREAEKYLTERVAHNRDDAVRMRVMEIVEKHAGGGTERARLLREAHLSARELDVALQTLEQMGRVRLVTEKAANGKRAQRILATGPATVAPVTAVA